MATCSADSMVTPRPPGGQELLLWSLAASVPLEVCGACVDLAPDTGSPLLLLTGQSLLRLSAPTCGVCQGHKAVGIKMPLPVVDTIISE